MIRRVLEKSLKEDAQYYSVLTLTGPRQSGKTTLAKAAFPDYQYVSLEDIDQRTLAREDPRGFLNALDEHVILDEVQRVPDIFSYIQTAVDSHDAPGQYILTGSNNFLLMNDVSQSLAGRCGVLHLLPFSRAELEEQGTAVPTDPKEIFCNRETSLDLWNSIFTGFYPRIHDRGIPPAVWHSDYLQTYIERDVRSLVNIGNLETFERFLALCASRIGQLLNLSNLALDCGISVDTAKRWISVLKTSFLVYLLSPHHSNFNKRIIKSPKLYFYDTGLVCNLLGIRNVEQLVSHPLRGYLFENYVLSEVSKLYLHNRRIPPIYFWRDKTGHEIDLLIEENGQLFPFEIKSGQTLSSDMFKTLVWWSKLSGRPLGKASLVYGGNDNRTWKGISVYPWFGI
ncbi:ATP-binding protein [Verrucomicrobiota bacterium]